MTKPNKPTVEGDLRELLSDALAPKHVDEYGNVNFPKLIAETDKLLQAIANTKENMQEKVASSKTTDWYLEELPLHINGGKWKLTMYKHRHIGRGTNWYTFAYVHINDQMISGVLDTESGKGLYITEAETALEAVKALYNKLKGEGLL